MEDEEAEKSIVLVTTGLADSGYTGEDGPFDENYPGGDWISSVSHVRLYSYANGAVDTAADIKNAGVTIYTVGLFQTMENIPEQRQGAAWLFRQTAAEIASSKAGFYPVETPEALKETFETVAQAVGGTLKETPAFLPGDVDFDGSVPAADARLILRASVGLEDPKTWIG